MMAFKSPDAKRVSSKVSCYGSKCICRFFMSHEVISDAKEGHKMKVATFARHCRTQNSRQLCGITTSYHEMKKESDFTDD